MNMGFRYSYVRRRDLWFCTNCKHNGSGPPHPLTPSITQTHARTCKKIKKDVSRGDDACRSICWKPCFTLWISLCPYVNFRHLTSRWLIRNLYLHLKSLMLRHERSQIIWQLWDNSEFTCRVPLGVAESLVLTAFPFYLLGIVCKQWSISLSYIHLRILYYIVKRRKRIKKE